MDDDDLTEADKAIILKLEGLKVKVFYMSHMLKGSNSDGPTEKDLPKPTDIYTLSYTSGTTGEPKGAMIAHKNIVCASQVDKFDAYFESVDRCVHLSYLPLPHVFERLLFGMVCHKKGKYGMFNGNVLKLKEDLAILKPNIFVSVPRLFNKFCDTIKMGLGQATGVKKWLVDRAVKVKMENYEEDGSVTDWFYDKLVFSKMKAVLGGEVKILLTGSAPIALEVIKFLKICFCANIAEGYGQTEGTAGEFLPDMGDHSSGNVGGVAKHLEMKLIDVPEMKYLSTDVDEQGRPTPRGEILVRGHSVIPGYYKNETQTNEAIDKDGWLHSGDIGMLLAENRALKIIDRVKNIFKLSQGEYVAPDRLEQVYKTCQPVEDIFVYGDSFKSCLVACIYVNAAGLKAYSKDANLDVSAFEDATAEAINKKEFTDIVLKSLNEASTIAKLKGFERIKKVYLCPKDFGVNKLVTATFKLKRNEAKAFFQQNVDEMYVGLD